MRESIEAILKLLFHYFDSFCIEITIVVIIYWDIALTFLSIFLIYDRALASLRQIAKYEKKGDDEPLQVPFMTILAT